MGSRTGRPRVAADDPRLAGVLQEEWADLPPSPSSDLAEPRRSAILGGMGPCRIMPLR